MATLHMRLGLARHGAMAVVLALGLLASGCSSNLPGAGPSSSGTAGGTDSSSRHPSSADSRSAQSPSAHSDSAHSDSAHSDRAQSPSAHSLGALAHVVIIVMENKAATSILGSSAAPYLNRLASQFAVATDYSAVTHPSLPNYLALTGGSTAGITTDCAPGPGCEVHAPSIAEEIEASGRSWRMYAESMPAPCATTSTGPYAVKHNPFLYYPNVTGDSASCALHDVPFTQFGVDVKRTDTLPDYAFISPNLCNDMHNCSVRTGDDWLAKQVPAILHSPSFTKQNSLLVIVWDEDDGGSNIVPAIFAGPAAKTSYTSGAAYDHYSLLHTIEKAWSLAPLTGNDADAPVMNAMLR